MRSHGSYQALVQDPEVDIVYIGTLADTHEDLCMLALEAGKHVLVEKPITLDAAGARRVVTAAKEKGLFLMEGMWSRCFPAMRKARELLNSGVIGDVVMAVADFGWPAVEVPDGPHARLFNRASGGASLDVGVYPVAHVLLGSAGAAPSQVVATGTAAGPSGGRVDWSASASLGGFPAPAHPGFTASVLVTLRASTPEEAVYTGTKGTLRVHRAAHTPTKLTLTTFQSRTESTEEVIDFPLPPAPAGAIVPFNYPGSEGFIYEGRAAIEALRAGLTESPDWTHAESLAAADVVEAMRRQVLEFDAKA